MMGSDAEPQTLPHHPNGQNLAICQELDSLLTGLQSSCHALHHHSQACSVLGVTPGIPACPSDTPQSMPTSRRLFNANLPSSSISAPQQQQQQLQQLGTQNQCLQVGDGIADSITTSNRSPSDKGQHAPKAAHAETHSTVQAQHPEHTLFPGPMLTPSIGQGHQQQQHQTRHHWSAHQQQLGLAEQHAAQSERWSQETAQGIAQGHRLWGSAVASAQKLWKNLIYDTQVVGFPFVKEVMLLRALARLGMSSLHLHAKDNVS